jgi:hypothetical protein
MPHLIVRSGLPMIVRVSSAIVSVTQAGVYLEYVGRGVIPGYETAAGLISVSRRSGM